ncbi:MAG: HAMP domain-containing histidine kinase, partial [Bacteroidia bacterium]|nr:HAMP domain-containing histidine kinase [Bacteroidia bacterium]
VCGLLLVIGFLFVVYRMFVQKKKANNIITQKNTQLEQANTEISAQRDKIEIQRDEIALQRDTVAQQKDQLAETLDTLRLTQAQLVESEKMASLGNLVAGVAHEINTPVGIGITASSAMVEDTKQFADLYKNGQMTRQQLENFLDNIYKTGNLLLKNLNRTGDLVQSFKQVSVDQLSEQMRSFNLKDYINDLLLSLKPELDKKTVDVEIECDKALEIYSYPGVFAQIITNFVTNSIKHGFRNRTSGTIKISVYNEVNNLLLEFKDDGIGIPEEIQPKIFDPFFTTNKQTGTGLGLHIVYNLVKQKLSGKISCYSRAGEGATFICTIPLA